MSSALADLTTARPNADPVTVQVSPQGTVTGAVLDQEGEISRGKKIR